MGKRPKISVLLITVRPDFPYLDEPNWHVLAKPLDDLFKQTFRDFEVVIVDGLAYNKDERGWDWWPRTGPKADWARDHVQWKYPRQTLAVRNRKVAICAYRNTGLVYARGELITNLDDCAELPPDYLEHFWQAWSEHRVCISPLWRQQGDTRSEGRVNGRCPRCGIAGAMLGTERNCTVCRYTAGPTEDVYPCPGIYGFGSYPLKTAIALGGYDEAFDLGQGLEDADWSTRLHNVGVQQALIHIPGFVIHPQSRHDPRCIDLERPMVRCCNTSWNLQRTRRAVRVANRKELWDVPNDSLRRLVGPCLLLNGDGTCQYHGGNHPCAYLEEGFAKELDPLAAKIYDDPPIFDLAQARKEAGVDE